MVAGAGEGQLPRSISEIPAGRESELMMSAAGGEQPFVLAFIYPIHKAVSRPGSLFTSTVEGKLFSMSLDCIESSEHGVQFSEVVGSRGMTKPPAQTCPLLGQFKMLECQLMAGFCVISELILILYARSLVPI